MHRMLFLGRAMLPTLRARWIVAPREAKSTQAENDFASQLTASQLAPLFTRQRVPLDFLSREQ